MHSSSDSTPHGAQADAGVVPFSHITHEEPVDYRELEAPQETGIGGPALFQAPPASAASPASSAPTSGSRPSSSQGPDNRKNTRRRSSRSRRPKSRH